MEAHEIDVVGCFSLGFRCSVPGLCLRLSQRPFFWDFGGAESLLFFLHCIVSFCLFFLTRLSVSCRGAGILQRLKCHEHIAGPGGASGIRILLYLSV